ncbi:MAG: hypothetical protein ABGY42_14820 [bacterium]
MSVVLNEAAIRLEMAPLLDAPEVSDGLRAMVNSRFLLAFFLMSVSEGEAMGEAGVATLREEEIAQLIHDIERQEREEGSHKEGTANLGRELFPEFFDGDEYRYNSKLTGRDYYLTVLQQNRQYLKKYGRYSRLNLYLMTTFGYEIMVVLYYTAVIDAVEASKLPSALKARVASELRRILSEEETHLEIEDQHNALLAADASKLSERTRDLLKALGGLKVEDYRWATELSMHEVVKMIGRYSAGDTFQREIEAP